MLNNGIPRHCHRNKDETERDTEDGVKVDIELSQSRIDDFFEDRNEDN